MVKLLSVGASSTSVGHCSRLFATLDSRCRTLHRTHSHFFWSTSPMTLPTSYRLACLWSLCWRVKCFSDDDEEGGIWSSLPSITVCVIYNNVRRTAGNHQLTSGTILSFNSQIEYCCTHTCYSLTTIISQNSGRGQTLQEVVHCKLHSSHSCQLYVSSYILKIKQVTYSCVGKNMDFSFLCRHGMGWNAFPDNLNFLLRCKHAAHNCSSTW